MRNILEKVKRRDEQQIKSEAQKIYLAENVARAKRAFERFRFHWRSRYPAMIRQLERDLPDLLHFFAFPRHLWRRLRTTNVIERCFVEVRRRTRPIVVFTNVASVERIIYAIFSRFNEDWKNHTLELFTQAACRHLVSKGTVTFSGQSQFPLGGSIEVTFHGMVSGTSLTGTTDMTSSIGSGGRGSRLGRSGHCGSLQQQLPKYPFRSQVHHSSTNGSKQWRRS